MEAIREDHCKWNQVFQSSTTFHVSLEGTNICLFHCEMNKQPPGVESLSKGGSSFQCQVNVEAPRTLEDMVPFTVAHV